MLPDVNFFIFMYTRKDATLSSQVEGTQATFADVLKVEAKIKDGEIHKDVDEILNYIKAMDYGLKRLEELKRKIEEKEKKEKEEKRKAQEKAKRKAEEEKKAEAIFDELDEKEQTDEAKDELFNLRFQLATNQLTNTSRIGEVRRQIARIKTLTREKELSEEGAR